MSAFRTAVGVVMTIIATLPTIATGEVGHGELQRQRPVRVVIDPGHGGQNMGALGAYGVHEKYVTLSISKKVSDLLATNPALTVFMTRKDDVFVSLKERPEMANAVSADLFVSIHCNAEPGDQAHGIETFYLGGGSDPQAIAVAQRENAPDAEYRPATTSATIGEILNDIRFNGNQQESAALAGIVQDSLIRTFPKAMNRDVRQARFTVLEYAQMPAVVVEVGFLTHHEEGADLLMEPYQDRIANAIAQAITRYVKEAHARPAFARQLP